MRARWSVEERLNTPVFAVRRHDDSVDVVTHTGSEAFDEVVLACHSDQALALLADADRLEYAILGAMSYQTNDTVLHTDATLLPRSRKAWAAWNAFIRPIPATRAR